MKKKDIFFLVMAIGFVVFQHFYYFTELYYDCDLVSYVSDVLNILNKGTWFDDLSNKTPAISLIIIAAFSLFGESFKSIYLAALFFNFLSILFIYLLARLILSKELKLYSVLPILFALFFVSEPLRTYTANTEVFLITFEIAGILFLGLNRYFISGLILGLGFLIRQTGILTFLAGALFLIATNRLNKEPLKALVKRLLSFTAGLILPLALVSFYFLYLGFFNKFFKNNFINNLKDFGGYTIVRKRDLLFTKIMFWGNFSFEIILYGLLSFFGLLHIAFKKTKTGILFGFWFLVIFLWLIRFAIYPHHFIQLIAPISFISLLGITYVFESIRELFKKNVYLKIISISLLTVILIIPYLRLVKRFMATKRPISYSYAAEDRLSVAKYIKEHTTHQDKIFIWDTYELYSIYFWSQRYSSTKNSLMSKNFSRDLFLPVKLGNNWIPLRRKNYKLFQKQLLLDFRLKLPKYIILVPRPDYRMIPNKSGKLEVRRMHDSTFEKNAFPEFFQILDKEYTIEKEIGYSKIQIYRYKNEKKYTNPY